MLLEELKEYGQILQTGAIVFAFVYLTIKLPAVAVIIFDKWAAYRREQDNSSFEQEEKRRAAEYAEAERIRDYQMRERTADREARHASNALFQSAVTEAFREISELRVALNKDKQV